MMKQKIMRPVALTLVLSAVLTLAPQSAFAAKKDTFTWNEKIQQYQAIGPEYRFDPEADKPADPDSASRFVKNEEGIYFNPDAEQTNEATLMITGDLMCQRAQQEAAFTGTGEIFLQHEDVLQIKKESQAKLEAAKEEILLGGTDASGVRLPASDYGAIPQPAGSWDFSPSFQYVRQILEKGDLVIGNLETMLSQSSPLTMQCRRLEDKPYLNSPVEFLDAIRFAGYDVLTMANNHNCDVGVQGLLETLENADRYEFLRTGMFADEEEPRYLVVDVNGIKVGIVSYATYFNKKEDNFTKEGQNVLLNEFDIDKARRDIKAAKKAGAEFIIAFMHWGKENTHETTSKQERYARYAARAGADYIVGSHPHALQPYDIIELSNGREVPVIYSMGNFLSCMSLDINNDTQILQLNLKKDADGIVSVASHRLYPCTIVEDLELTDENGTVRSDDFVIVPQMEKYAPLLSGKSAASRNDVSFLKASYDRILSVYDGQMLLPIPYDPYHLQNDDDRFTKAYLLNRFRWVMANQPV